MRILIVSDAWLPQVNGVVRTYEFLGAELRRSGHEVEIIGPADFSMTVPMPGYAEIRLPLFASAGLKRRLASRSFDTLHIATEGFLGHAAKKYCLERNIPFTTCYHTEFPDYVAKRVARYFPFLYGAAHRLSVSFIRRFHAGSACLFVATASLEKKLLALGYRVPMKRLTRGVDHTIFFPGAGGSDFDAIQKPVALCVARVSIEKNIEAFLDADWEGGKVLIGDGPDLERLRQKYAGNKNILFTGKRSGAALGDAYRAADIFVFPSRTDTFGMVIVEALACGLPVAAYSVPGPADIVTGDFLGTLKDDLALAMRDAARAPGTAADRFAHISAHYTWEEAAHQFLEGSF